MWWAVIRLLRLASPGMQAFMTGNGCSSRVMSPKRLSSGLGGIETNGLTKIGRCPHERHLTPRLCSGRPDGMEAMKRRSFLGFLGGAAAAGPSMAKGAADIAMSDLRLAGSMYGDGSASAGYPITASGSASSWAKESLERFLGKTPDMIAYEKRGRSVHALEPDVASMRSLSMRAKVSMSRDRQYERATRQEHENLLGHIAGWWS